MHERSAAPNYRPLRPRLLRRHESLPPEQLRPTRSPRHRRPGLLPARGIGPLLPDHQGALGAGNPRLTDLLATTGDILRLWELTDDPSYSNTIGRTGSGFSQRLIKKSELMNVRSPLFFYPWVGQYVKQTDFCAPLTSFDWNDTDPSLIVTSSIDTTCTVWNVETNTAKTQLIAHDKEVYDVAFAHGMADIFASVGADGSVRMFDLRCGSLEHSTIIYETPATPATANTVAGASSPLLRLQFNRLDTNYLATFHMDSPAVQILDVRAPGAPVTELKGHSATVNCISWAPHISGNICTGGDDQQVLVWDLNSNPPSSGGTDRSPSASTSTPSAAGAAPPGSAGASRHHHHHSSSSSHHHHHQQKVMQDPILAYTADSEINSLCWNQSLTDWIAVGFGRTVQALRV
ncbi:WD40 repeat-containing protein [Jimgerdemannia flammicorona]|uniref:WD40 repeat-containing protein n=1 Tax=Jimgerdemannia flammicorona TaxID=994334 RepID=A0A433QBZ1_9FUNG|nr:WD40 repeat-containing protein [Jimgerdemannia flammicorona]